MPTTAVDFGRFDGRLNELRTSAARVDRATAPVTSQRRVAKRTGEYFTVAVRIDDLIDAAVQACSAVEWLEHVSEEQYQG